MLKYVSTSSFKNVTKDTRQLCISYHTLHLYFTESVNLRQCSAVTPKLGHRVLPFPMADCCSGTRPIGQMDTVKFFTNLQYPKVFEMHRKKKAINKLLKIQSHTQTNTHVHTHTHTQNTHILSHTHSRIIYFSYTQMPFSLS